MRDDMYKAQLKRMVAEIKPGAHCAGCGLEHDCRVKGCAVLHAAYIVAEISGDYVKDCVVDSAIRQTQYERTHDAK